jgi:signal transduction histidine kinase
MTILPIIAANYSLIKGGRVSHYSLAQRALTNQLLTFGRKKTYSSININISDEINSLVSLVKRTVGTSIAFDASLSENIGTVKVDPVQLQHIIINLATNAKDAMPDGGTLTVETKNIHLKDSVEGSHGPVHPGNYVLLEVSDTGRGMDKECWRKAFKPYFSTKSLLNGHGTGLGLSTVHGIVTAHHGHIVIESVEKKGTHVKIFFPEVIT